MSIRQYILTAADYIRKNSDQFSISCIRIPTREEDVGCAIGWTVYFARIGDFRQAILTSIFGDARLGAYCSHEVLTDYFGVSTGKFFARMTSIDPEWYTNGLDCSRAMYAYANLYHPEESPANLSPFEWMKLQDREKINEIREFRFQEKVRDFIRRTGKAA